MSTVEHPKEELLISANDLAKRLSLSRVTIHQLTAPRGPLKSTRVGRRVLYHPDDVKTWLDGLRDKPAESTTRRLPPRRPMKKPD